MELSPQNVQFLDEQIARGIFTTRDEAVDEAIDLLRNRQSLYASIDGLEEMLVAGRAGPFRELKEEDWDRMKQGIRDRSAARNRNP
jgi:Arc/MetJ-type ribon-helix-helix transcriptional regulator